MKQTVNEYLSNLHEVIPDWLRNYKKGDPINIIDILLHRNLYYPGADTDGHPIKIFNKARYAHTFVYSDYGKCFEERYKELSEVGALRGYHLFDIRRLEEKELSPRGWTPHIQLNKREIEWIQNWMTFKPFAILAVYDRDDNYGEDHGAKRIAIIYVGGDGIATYDALYTNNNLVPSVLLIQNHGFGGNWTTFGRNGPLEYLCKKINKYPKFIMCNNQSDVFYGYSKVRNTLPEMRGYDRRYLYHVSIYDDD